MLTKKGKYGLKAMVHLAGRPVGETTLVSDIAMRMKFRKNFSTQFSASCAMPALFFQKKAKAEATHWPGRA